MELTLLSIEISFNLCSVSIKTPYKVFYKEYRNKVHTIKDIIQMIDSILLDSNCSYNDLNCIIFGDYPTGIVNIKSIILIMKSLAFSWKIPILKLSSLIAISAEVFFKYNYKDIVILINNGQLIYTCICNYNCNNFILSKCSSVTLKEYLNLKINNKYVGVFNYINVAENKIEYHDFFDIKVDILPKAIYTNFIAEKLILEKKLIFKNKIRSLYFYEDGYKKYTY